jgi:hypothetical protein
MSAVDLPDFGNRGGIAWMERPFDPKVDHHWTDRPMPPTLLFLESALTTRPGFATDPGAACVAMTSTATGVSLPGDRA